MVYTFDKANANAPTRRTTQYFEMGGHRGIYHDGWFANTKVPIAPWSPRFDAKPLPAALVGTAAAPIVNGAQLFHDKGCEFCHTVDGQGGMRGPDLTLVANRLSVNDLRIKIANGGSNMPSFAGILTHDDLDNLVTFLESRTTMRPGQTSR